MTTDVSEIRRFAEILLKDPGTVLELRAIGVDRVRGRGVVSGYFDNADALLTSAEALDGRARGVYVTLNPVNPALLARSNNRTQVLERTTSDSEIDRRRWMLIDIDPTRPSGISSSDSEKNAAREVMGQVVRALPQLGFPDPIMGDSGNGWHLIFSIDLPPDDEGLVRRCLQALAFRFDTDAVTVDQTVHNPARITKLFGTMARKGDETPDRPHRRSRLVHVPDEIRPVEKSSLEQLATVMQQGTLPGGTTESAFDVDEFLEEHGLDVARSDPWNGGRRWVLEVCPFNNAHTDGSAYVVQFSNGAIAAGCHHNGCAGKNWADLRGTFDRGWRDRRAASGSYVSVAGEGIDDFAEPEPLPSLLPAVAPFDFALLPRRIRPWIQDIAERLQCPSDYPAVGTMVALASVIGRKVGIRPKRHDNWLVVPNLYGAVIGRPGIMKTPALQEPLNPLKRLEIEAKERFEDEMKQHQAAELIAEANRKIKKDEIKRALKGGTDATHIAQKAVDEETTRPARRRYIVNDSTIEKLGETLAENPNGVLVYRDELVGFLKTLDKEGRETDRSFYLEAWNGNGRYTYDRIGRGTIDIEAAIVSIMGCIQPGPLTAYLRAAVKSGAGDDGLLQRFQLAVWPDNNKTWANVDRAPDREVRDEAYGVFDRLDKLKSEDIEASEDMLDAGSIPYLHFTDEAQENFDEWQAPLEVRLRNGDEHPAMESHLSKYRSLIPSLALIIHLADGASGPVTAGAVRRAIAWGEYLESHARRLFAQAIQHDAVAGHALAKRILKTEIGPRFTRRDVYRRGWAGLSTSHDAEEAIDYLIDLGWLGEQTLRTGGRPTVRFVVNPRISELATRVTDRTDGSPSSSASGSSVSASDEGERQGSIPDPPSRAPAKTDETPPDGTSVGSVSAQGGGSPKTTSETPDQEGAPTSAASSDDWGEL